MIVLEKKQQNIIYWIQYMFKREDVVGAGSSCAKISGIMLHKLGYNIYIITEMMGLGN